MVRFDDGEARVIIRALLLLFALAGCQAPIAIGPIGFPETAIRDHRIAGTTDIEVPAESGRDYYGEIDIDLTIGPDGVVTDARVARNGNFAGQDSTPALAAARALKFRPFTYRGRPVIATGYVRINTVAGGKGGWRDPEAALPPINYASLKISLSRTGCFGTCPAYALTIDGAGNVVFMGAGDGPGAGGVLLPGERRAKIDRKALDGLIQKFRAIHFFGLKPKYQAGVTDSVTTIIRFESAGKSWTVEDYVGERAGMPVAVTALEDAIDAAVGIKRWTTGDANTVPALLAEGFDPSGKEAADIATFSTRWGDGRAALDLVAAGLPLDQVIEREGARFTLGEMLLESAARNGQPTLFAAVAEKGWLKRLPKAELDTLFAESAGGYDPATARAMVAAGADPNARTPPQSDSYSGGRKTALMIALGSYSLGGVRSSLAHVTALLDLGADPNAVDEFGRNALYGVEDLELLEHLLAAGVRADIRDKDGNSPVFGSWTDVIVLRLLDAGADPKGFYTEGDARKTLRQMAAQDRPMPGVLAWLDGRRIR